jgi:hypothetical protein
LSCCRQILFDHEEPILPPEPRVIVYLKRGYAPQPEPLHSVTVLLCEGSPRGVIERASHGCGVHARAVCDSLQTPLAPRVDTLGEHSAQERLEEIGAAAGGDRVVQHGQPALGGQSDGIGNIAEG